MRLNPGSDDDRGMTTSENTSELHAVFATDHQHQTFRVSDALSWDAAQSEWQKLDDQRLAGVLPHAKYFEVRTVWLGPDRALVGPEVRSHDRYDRAPVDLMFTRQVVFGQRGWAKLTDAARAAWRYYFPEFRERGHRGRYAETSTEQGRGGWFYYPNGCTAAQGLQALGKVCLRRHMLVRGANGRYYVVNPDVVL